jgi:hypothetical protein
MKSKKMKSEYRTPEKNSNRTKKLGTGEFFTPPEVIDALLPKSIPYAATVLEPTCGDGNLLEAIIVRKFVDAFRVMDQENLGEEASRGLIYKIAETLFAFEYMKDNCLVSRKRVKKLLVENGRVEINKEGQKILDGHIIRNIIWADALKMLSEFDFYVHQIPQYLTGSMYSGLRMDEYCTKNHAYLTSIYPTS